MLTICETKKTPRQNKKKIYKNFANPIFFSTFHAIPYGIIFVTQNFHFYNEMMVGVLHCCCFPHFFFAWLGLPSPIKDIMYYARNMKDKKEPIIFFFFDKFKYIHVAVVALH
jgi:hypothetical protein